MPLGEDFGTYSAAQLDAIVTAGGGLRRGKTRQELKAALDQAFLAAQLHAAYQRNKTTSPARSDEFEKVARASERLLKLLNVETDGKPQVGLKLRGSPLRGLQGQGSAWAQRWFEAAKREKRIELFWRDRERELIAQGKPSEAAALREKRERRRRSRKGQWERWRRLHGGWPGDNEHPTVFETSDGSRALLFGEDLALVAAVEGVQRIRTWAALEAERLTKGSQFEAERKRSVRDTPLRRSQTILVGRLARLYPKFFGRKFGVSKLAEPTKTSGKPIGSVGGPGVRFMQACLGPIGVRMSADAIEKAWDATRSDQRSMGNRRRK